jgi:hypothetical protein
MRTWDVVQCTEYERKAVYMAVLIIQYLKVDEEQVEGGGRWNMSGCRIIEYLTNDSIREGGMG